MNIHITDHAFVRYLERGMGIHVKEMKNQILSDALRRRMHTLGDGIYPLGNGSGLRAVVLSGNVITFITPSETHS